MITPDVLPPELWDMIFVEPDVFRKGCTLNKEWNAYLYDLRFPQYARKGPIPYEVKQYILERHDARSIILFHPKRPHWKEIDVSTHLMILYSWDREKSTVAVAEKITENDLVPILTRLFKEGFLVDPCVYRGVIERRKSMLKWDSKYFDDCLMSYFEIIVKAFSQMEGIRWRLLHRSIDAIFLPECL